MRPGLPQIYRAFAAALAATAAVSPDRRSALASSLHCRRSHEAARTLGPMLGSNGVASDDLAGLHQYVFTFEGGAGSNGTFTGYKDGAPIVDKTGAPESFEYRSTLANILAAAGGGNWSFGGRHPDKGSRASPVGKAYKFAIYSDVLTAAEVAQNFSTGLNIPEPTALSLLSLGSLALLGWRRSR